MMAYLWFNGLFNSTWSQWKNDIERLYAVEKIPWEQWEQEAVLPTPGICSALKPILPLLPPLGGNGGT